MAPHSRDNGHVTAHTATYVRQSRDVSHVTPRMCGHVFTLMLVLLFSLPVALSLQDAAYGQRVELQPQGASCSGPIGKSTAFPVAQGYRPIPTDQPAGGGTQAVEHVTRMVPCADCVHYDVTEGRYTQQELIGTEAVHYCTGCATTHGVFTSNIPGLSVLQNVTIMMWVRIRNGKIPTPLFGLFSLGGRTVDVSVDQGAVKVVVGGVIRRTRQRVPEGRWTHVAVSIGTDPISRNDTVAIFVDVPPAEAPPSNLFPNQRTYEALFLKPKATKRDEQDNLLGVAVGHSSCKLYAVVSCVDTDINMDVREVRLIDYMLSWREIAWWGTGVFPAFNSYRSCVCPAGYPLDDQRNGCLGYGRRGSAYRMQRGEGEGEMGIADVVTSRIETWVSRVGVTPVTLTVHLNATVHLHEVKLLFAREVALSFASLTVWAGPGGELQLLHTISQSCPPPAGLPQTLHCSQAQLVILPESAAYSQRAQYTVTLPVTQDQEALVADTVRLTFHGFITQQPELMYYSLAQLIAMAEECTCSPGGTVDGSTTCSARGCVCRPDGGDPKLAGVTCAPYLLPALPTFGPVSGNTHIILRGGFLGPGVTKDPPHNLTYTIQANLCFINSSIIIPLRTEFANDTFVRLRSPNVSSQLGPQGGAALIELSYEGRRLVTTNFTFRPDPIIETIEPRNSILRGGVVQTVTGQHLDSVFAPILTITIVYDYKDVFEQPNNQACTVVNSTVMLCPTPAIHNCSFKFSDRIPTCSRRTRRSLSDQVQDDQEFQRQRRDVIPYSLNDKELQFYLSFKLDGVDTYHNVSDALPDEGIVNVFHDPVIKDFEGDDRVHIFDQYKGDKHLEISGVSLNLGVRMSDYKVVIGIDGQCEMFELYTSHIYCTPPSDQPPVGPVHKQGAPHVVVHIGTNLRYSPGYVHYAPCLTCHPSRKAAVVGASLGCVVVLLLAIGLLVWWWRRRQTAAKRPQHLLDMQYTSNPYSRNMPPSLLELFDDESLKTKIRACMLGKDSLQPWPLTKQLGKGEFGVVYEGMFNDENNHQRSVAVKSIRGWSEGLIKEALLEYSRHAREFLEEALIMKEYNHEHVLSLIGVIIDQATPYVILPLMELGDLRNFVLNPENSFTVRELVEYALQVARGMEYLAQHRFVHRDLAARNCMVNSDHVVKIADFGLARDIYERDYYHVQDKARPLPMKWMAPESLIQSKFTAATDVWSYGVVLWELMTRGVKPYPDVNNQEIKSYLMSGRRMAKPPAAPDEVYALMLACWNEDPDRRPGFSRIVKDLEALLSDDMTSSEDGSTRPPSTEGGAGRTMYENLLRYVDPQTANRHDYLSLATDDEDVGGYADLPRDVAGSRAGAGTGAGAGSGASRQPHARDTVMPPQSADRVARGETTAPRDGYTNLGAQGHEAGAEGDAAGSAYVNISGLSPAEMAPTPSVRAKKPAPSPKPNAKLNPQAVSATPKHPNTSGNNSASSSGRPAPSGAGPSPSAPSHASSGRGTAHARGRPGPKPAAKPAARFHSSPTVNPNYDIPNPNPRT